MCCPPGVSWIWAVVWGVLAAIWRGMAGSAMELILWNRRLVSLANTQKRIEWRSGSRFMLCQWHRWIFCNHPMIW
jgi:hypothetical protein